MIRNLLFIIAHTLIFFLVKITGLLCMFFQCRKWQPYITGNKPSVMWLEPFFPENAGYHWRAGIWSELLSEKGFKTRIKYSTSREELEAYSRGETTKFFLKFLVVRFLHCFHALGYKTIVVRREILLFNDYGNLFMEKFLLRIHPHVILDFDDDIAASKGEYRKVTSWFGRLMLENGNKFNDSLRLYKRFIVASNYLKEKVLRENPSVAPKDILVIPTCVDYDKNKPKVYDVLKPVVTFGWIGGNQNQQYLQDIIPDLNKLAEKYPIELKVITGKPFVAKTNFPIINYPWNLEDEVEQLKTIDVGLMPLPLNERTKGKGGFKLIQYMGLGIVSVASAITINTEIIDSGVNGFLVEPNHDWTIVLEKVLEQRSKFPTFAKSVREKIMKGYTFQANYNKMENFIQKIHES